jgi:uncharacterized protein (DUF58 family)
MLIFDEATLRKLEQLSLVASRVRVGLMKGERRSRKKGSSIEFADYREYSPGDDLRRLDWNVFARLERPFIKLLEEEEDLAVHILVDASASMNWPDSGGEANKFQYAIRLAGALGYIALVTGDRVAVTWLTSHGNRGWGPYRGRQNALPMFQYLEAGEAIGITSLDVATRDYALRARGPGLLILISDLFSPSGFTNGLNALLGRGYEVAIVQLLSADESNPPLGGDVKLVDVETGAGAELTLDVSTINLYKQRLREWQSEIAKYAANHGINYVPVTTDLPWDKLVLQSLRARDIVR